MSPVCADDIGDARTGSRGYPSSGTVSMCPTAILAGSTPASSKELALRQSDPQTAQGGQAFASGPDRDFVPASCTRAANRLPVTPAPYTSGARTSRLILIMRIFGDPAEEMRTWTGSAEDTVRDRYLAAFGRPLPGLSPAEPWFRIRGILAVAAVTASSSTTGSLRPTRPRANQPGAGRSHSWRQR